MKGAPLLFLIAACSSSPTVARQQHPAPRRTDPPAPRRPSAPAGSIVFAGVSLVPMDREGVLRDQTVVVADGRIHAIAPAASVDVPASATRIDARGRFLLPGLADMHAHAVDDEALFLYLAAGVTQLRVPGTSPQAIAQRDRVAGGALIGPSILIEDQVAGPRLTVEQYDLLTAAARTAGQRVIGQVPEAVGLAHALAARQSSIEHLGGYNLHLSDPNAYASKRRYWQSTPGDVAGFVASFQFIEESRLEEAARLTREAGTWNCPTLVLHEHATRAGDSKARASARGARYLSPERKTSGHPAAFPSVATARYQMEAMSRARPKRLALVRALDAAGAGLLVGTGSGTPGMVPGFAVQDEIELLVEAGVTPWRALRAATSGAASYLGQEDSWGSIAVGRRADLLLLGADPTADVRALGSRIGVMVRGRWFPASEIEAELARLAAYADGTRSRLAGSPAIPVDGTREHAARYTTHRAGEFAGEQRVAVDRRADGTRVITAEMLSAAGAERVRIESGTDGHASVARHESARGLLELRRVKGKLEATFTPAAGAALAARFDLPRGAGFNLPTVAADHLLYPAAMKLRPGGQVTLQLVHVVAGSKLIAGPAILRLLRQPDRKDAPGRRFFSVAFTARNQTVKGGLILDEDGRLVEQSYLDTTIRRAD